ncbi:hypothetical protein D3C80_1758330 [compost metagenome]
MERIYFNLYEIDQQHFEFMRPLYAILVEAFASREGVIRLKDRLLVEYLAETGHKQSTIALAKATDSDMHYELLKEVHNQFTQLLAISRRTGTTSASD